MKRVKHWWIRERHNPQLGVYYVAHGQMTKVAALSYEKESLYGDNRMLCFETEADYNAKIKALKDAGESVS